MTVSKDPKNTLTAQERVLWDIANNTDRMMVYFERITNLMEESNGLLRELRDQWRPGAKDEQ